MKKSNEEIDALIREALNREHAEAFEALGEPSIFQQALDVLRGRQRWMAATVMVVTLVLVAGAVYCAIQVFQETAVVATLRWLGGFFLCMMVILALKIWYWMEMNRLTLTREVKRLELQVAHLLERLA